MAASLPVLDEAEIAIVGAGPAGSIAALTLAELGHDVVLIDKRSFPREKACGDGLTGSAVAFLHELGLEGALAGAQQVDAMRIFVDWRERESIAMRAGPSGHRGHACCIPRKQFDHALVEMACAARVRLVHGYVTQPLLNDGSVAGVELTDGTGPLAINARHVIAADGATSRLRRQLDGKRPRPGTFAYAVRRYVRSHQSLTPSFEIYAPLPEGVLNYGYGWVFPIGDRIANVGVGYLSGGGLPHPRSINELLNSFLAALKQYHGDRLGDLEPIGRAIGGSFGGDFSAERCQRGGVIFLGDAAQTTDPITGEGIDQAMRSAYTVAVTLDRAIQRGTKRLDVGRAIGLANLRLGQDSSMIGREAHHLLKRRAKQPADSRDLLSGSGPLLSGATAMLAADTAYPSMATTPIGSLASRLGCADRLAAFDERLREEIHCDFILAAELIQREVYAGLGPVAALTVIGSELACGPTPTTRSVNAALCVELLSAFPKMLSCVSAEHTWHASTNNTLALMVGDYSLCRALALSLSFGAEDSEAFGEAIEANSEGIALLAHDQAQAVRSVEHYIDWACLTSGTNLSLAAGFGARLAGADPAVLAALRVAGESLGIAVQICEDILALQGDDPITGRRPRHVLENGHFALPVLIALKEDSRLASHLAGKAENMTWNEIIERIREGQGLIQATKVCQQYIERAKEIAVEMTGDRDLLMALCELPERVLASGSCYDQLGV
jgi:geranylgeranyl reductase family protein